MFRPLGECQVVAMPTYWYPWSVPGVYRWCGHVPKVSIHSFSTRTSVVTNYIFWCNWALNLILYTTEWMAMDMYHLFNTFILCACVCLCVCVCMYICMYVCVCIHVFVFWRIKYQLNCRGRKQLCLEGVALVSPFSTLSVEQEWDKSCPWEKKCRISVNLCTIVFSPSIVCMHKYILDLVNWNYIETFIDHKICYTCM